MGKDSVATHPLADLDAIVAREFEKDFPIELTKAISGALQRVVLQYLATNAVRSEGKTIQAVTGMGLGLAQSMTRADWRSWTTLPKRIEFCKIPTPASGELTLRGVDTNISYRSLDVCKNQYSLGPKRFGSYASSLDQSFCLLKLDLL